MTEPIGLIPCAGYANRVSPLPCSKEILPVGLHPAADGSPRTKVVSHYLLDGMRRGGVRRAFFILRKGKWDIPEYYGHGEMVGMDLGYLFMNLPYGPPFTLDQAVPFVRGHRIALGFPDILFGPADAYARAFERLGATGADLVLGLYRAHDSRACDMAQVDRSGLLRNLIIRPEKTPLTWSWMFAVWTPAFTEFLHDYLTLPRTAPQQHDAGLPAELTMGHVIQASIRAGLKAQSVAFPDDDYLDVGTPAGLHRAIVNAGSRASGEALILAPANGLPAASCPPAR